MRTTAGRRLRFGRWLVAAVAIGLAWVGAAAAGRQQVPEIAAFVEQVDRLEKQCQPSDLACLVRLGEAQTKIGRLVPAAATLDRVLRADARHVPALVAFGRLHRRLFQFDKALAMADRVRKLAPASVAGRLLSAELAMDRMDYAAAAALYRAVLTEHPRETAAIVGLAEIDYWENRYDEAARRLAGCLEIDAKVARAWLFSSLIHRIRQENDQWAAAGRRAVESDPLDDEARANLSNILMRGEKKSVEGYAEARVALLLNRYCYPAHNYIGNGWTSRTYPNIEVPEAIRTAVGEAMARGDSMLTARRLPDADAAFDAALALLENHVPALVGKGVARYHRKDYDGALEWFFKALDVDPDYGLAHYGVAMSLLRKRDLVNVRLADIERRFAGRDAPEPPSIRAVFTNYADLDAEMQRILRLSVQPLKGYLPALEQKKSTFVIFPFHHFLWQVPAHRNMKGTRTFDGRLWDDVKGAGGRNASSGEEWQRDVKFLRFNVVAHEFTHQVHGFLPEALQAELKALYADASKTGKTLDFYSQANVSEYFAVGVEAYVSEDKLADQKITYGHTRRELQERDPALFAFIQRLDEQGGARAGGARPER